MGVNEIEAENSNNSAALSVVSAPAQIDQIRGFPVDKSDLPDSVPERTYLVNQR